MAKRLTDTDKWKDDWYISLSNDYRIIWQWLLDNCNHAGICKRSIALLNRDCNTAVTEDALLSVMEGRVIVSGNIWFIPKFLRFQYTTLRSQKPVIVSVVKEIEKNKLSAMIPKSFGNDYIIIKDKDKDSVVTEDTAEKPKPIPTDAAKDFETFWNTYGKKTDRHKCEHAWFDMEPEERTAALKTVGAYVRNQPDPKFRKAPLNWLQGKCWNDEADTVDTVRFLNAAVGAYGTMPLSDWNKLHANNPNTTLQLVAQ